jgi:hypothetical protein
MRFKEIPMKFPLAILLGLMLSFDTRAFMVSETVYVEAPTDTDNDGKLDRIFVSTSFVDPSYVVLTAIIFIIEVSTATQ